MKVTLNSGPPTVPRGCSLETEKAGSGQRPHSQSSGTGKLRIHASFGTLQKVLSHKNWNSIASKLNINLEKTPTHIFRINSFYCRSATFKSYKHGSLRTLPVLEDGARELNQGVIVSKLINWIKSNCWTCDTQNPEFCSCSMPSRGFYNFYVQQFKYNYFGLSPSCSFAFSIYFLGFKEKEKGMPFNRKRNQRSNKRYLHELPYTEINRSIKKITATNVIKNKIKTTERWKTDFLPLCLFWMRGTGYKYG